MTASSTGRRNTCVKSPLCVPKTSSALISRKNRLTSAHHDCADVFHTRVLASPFKSKSRLEAENAALRHQLIILRRKVQGRVRLTNYDRWFLIQLYRWFPSTLKVIKIIRPETLVHWHRAGFRCYWRWKSLPRGGRPQIETDLRALIRRMSIENPLWGAPRIHGELLKLGFEVAQSSVAKYMVKRRGPSSQGWRTFLRNHAPDIAAMDRQLTEAFPWDAPPLYLIRDRDRIYGTVAICRMRAMGIRDKPRFIAAWKVETLGHATAIFRQVNKNEPRRHHDALEFPDGRIVLLTE